MGLLRKNRFPVTLRIWRRKKKRGKEKGKSLREGNFQDKEGGECTCNLTVMKGTPRKECTKTKVKRTRLEGGGLKKKEKKDLEFPARCPRTLRLPPSQAGPMK